MNGLAALREDYCFRRGDRIENGLAWIQNNTGISGAFWFEKTQYGGQPDSDPERILFDDRSREFLAALAMNDVSLGATFETRNGPITMSDMIKHLQMTVRDNSSDPWALIALTKYLPLNARWMNSNNEELSIEKLVELEVAKLDRITTPMDLFALAIARNRYLQSKQVLQGIWLEADRKLAAALDNADERDRAP